VCKVAELHVQHVNLTFNCVVGFIVSVVKFYRRLLSPRM
jgi:hypothetical protein